MPKTTTSSKIHIPGFGIWNVEKEAQISGYFDVARANRKEMKAETAPAAARHGGQKGGRPVEHQRAKDSGSLQRAREKHVNKPVDNGGHTARKREGLPQSTNSAPLSSRQGHIYQEMSPVHPSRRPQSAYSARPKVASVPVKNEFSGSRTPSPAFIPKRENKASKANKVGSNKSLPRLGDWDAGDPATYATITETFDHAMNARKGIPVSKQATAKTTSSDTVEEDLYKPTPFHRSRADKLFSYLSNLCGGVVVRH